MGKVYILSNGNIGQAAGRRGVFPGLGGAQRHVERIIGETEWYQPKNQGYKPIWITFSDRGECYLIEEVEVWGE